MQQTLKRHQKIRAVLSARGMLKNGFSPAQVAWLRGQGIVPGMAGADEDDEDDDDEDDSDDDEEDENDEEKKDPPKNKGGKKDDDDDDDDDAEVRVSKSELARLKRVAKEAAETKKRADEEKKRNERKKKQDEGKWQELVSEAEEKAKTAEQERDEARADLVKYKFNTRVTQVAETLAFKDPSDAHKYLPDNFDLESEEDDIERALKKVLAKKDYLAGARKSTGGGNGSRRNGGKTFTVDEIKNMSTDEINANWDKPGFQEALAQSG